MRARLATGTINDPVLFLRHKLTRPKSVEEKKTEPELPSTKKMAKNLVKSVVKNTANVIKGEGLKLSEEEAQRRLEICKRCEFFRHTDQRCGKCGCYMATKTYLKAEKCPTHKW